MVSLPWLYRGPNVCNDVDMLGRVIAPQAVQTGKGSVSVVSGGSVRTDMKLKIFTAGISLLMVAAGEKSEMANMKP